jgi:hypothetical protein
MPKSFWNSLANGKSLQLREGRGALPNLNASPLQICGTPKFIRSVREGEWSR